MKYEEIIKKLKESSLTIREFALENIPVIIEKYPEALEAKVIKKEFKKAHTINENNGWDSVESSKKYYSLPNEYQIAFDLYKKELGLNWVEVYQQGGEGEGDYWESVKYFPDDNVYIKVKGYYSSYEGIEFDGKYEDCCSEVKPVEKTITVYE